MKKAIIIIAAIAACFLIYKYLTGGNNDTTTAVGNRIVAYYPEGTITEATPQQPTRASIHIDASASMKPYFLADDPQITQTVQALQMLSREDSTDIYFIGKKQPYRGYVDKILTAVRQQPNDGDTTFDRFFANAATAIDSTGEIIYLVTDGIMSIGSNADTKNSLLQLQGRLRDALSGRSDIAAAILRYKGPFKGTYYNSLNHKVPLKEQPILPYYIIALGRQSAISWLQGQSPEALGKPEATLFMGLHHLAGHGSPVSHTTSKSDSTLLLDRDATLALQLPPCMAGIDQTTIATATVTIDGKPAAVNIAKSHDGCINITIPARTTGAGPMTATLTIPNAIPSQWTGEFSTEYDITGPDGTATFGLANLVRGLWDALEGTQPLITATYKYTATI